MFGRLLLLAVACAVAFAQSGATIEGRVVSKAGDPVRRAMVQVRAATNGPVSGVETDGEGRFAIRNVQADSALLNVIRSGYETTSQAVSIPAGQSTVNVAITMSRLGVIYGKVVDEYGDPFGRAYVTIYRRAYDNGWRWQQVNASTAGPDGNYSFGDLREGRYIVGVVDNTSPGVTGMMTRYVQTFYSGSTEISGATAIEVGPEAELRGIDIRLQKGRVFRVSGRVAVVEGMQSTNVQLVPDNPALGGGNRQVAPLNLKDGTFTIERVAEGSYYAQVRMTLRPLGPGGQPTTVTGSEPVTVSGRDVDNVVIQLVPGVEITGQVRIDGMVAPLPAGANPATAQPRITLRQMDPNANDGSSTALASADGKFVLRNLSQGTFLVSATGPAGTYMSSIRYDGEDATWIPITVGKSGGRVEVVLKTDGAVLSGVARDEKGDPLSETRVSIWPTNTKSKFVAVVNTDRAGNFRFQNVPPGEYRVTAWDRKMTTMQTYANLVNVPEFYRQFDSTASTVRLEPSGQQTQDVKVIPQMAMETALPRLP